jgi:hypothetical protein
MSPVCHGSMFGHSASSIKASSSKPCPKRLGLEVGREPEDSDGIPTGPGAGFELGDLIATGGFAVGNCVKSGLFGGSARPPIGKPVASQW